ncbi:MULTISPECIES: PAQR family membrane homeostasis protein TrhA [unclassified Aureimonas]|uniref:PAQR family membrane homeostasis protein TrhA n=1 Tax=unclassified Aureimonas TaxID=2615206 RepID=UPI0006FF14DB|nr:MULTISPECIES: hemolysin III family protein [unclassified Aureimonas]KQT64446.1 DNA-binding protein [Aureimonas sp. Leaf427]KQT81634.1 DNA-binding protein [Aureimonas sp. Leaf460]
MMDTTRGEVPWPYTPAETVADAIVHASGLILAVSGSAVFLVAIAGTAPGAVVAGVGVYLATLILSIGASATYNLWPVSRTKWLLRRLDHSAIYLLIAGTYTPFMVEMGLFSMLAAVWAIALAGVGLKLLAPGRYDRLSIGLYLALGWSGVAVWDTLTGLPEGVLVLIFAGGLVYSLGVIFHLWESLRYQNAIWHAFVLVAAAIHYVAVWTAVSAG